VGRVSRKRRIADPGLALAGCSPKDRRPRSRLPRARSQRRNLRDVRVFARRDGSRRQRARTFDEGFERSQYVTRPGSTCPRCMRSKPVVDPLERASTCVDEVRRC
jgi:hypothetical protein